MSQYQSFRDYIPPSDNPRSVQLANSNAYQWAAHRCTDPFMIGWMQEWKVLYDEPYQGISSNGEVNQEVHQLADKRTDLGAPVMEMCIAAKHLLSKLSKSDRERMSYPIDAPEWRSWSNPEIYVFRHGLRLEEVKTEIVQAIYGLLRASLSPSGYEKVRGCMKINGFLGKAVRGENVLNELSYNFAIFGTPSTKEPWGWQLYGHHLCLNCMVIGKQMVFTPIFMGAEPNIIDEGPGKGTELFVQQEKAGLRLIFSMDEATRAVVQVSADIYCANLPIWRYHRADQPHLGGAFQDNRIIPYEGCLVSNFQAWEQQQVRNILELSLDYLPEGALQARMSEIDEYWNETYFAWIGQFGEHDAFYYSIHSPVILFEFDHHSGVFLSNKEPRKFHIHTLVRTPNGNDYGKELIRQHEGRNKDCADRA